MYTVLGPLYPLLRATVPAQRDQHRAVGEAMIAAARHGAPKQVLENRDINELAQATMHRPDRRI